MHDRFLITDIPTKGRAALLRVSGRLDTKNATVLLGRCQEVRSSGRDLVLNLAGVTFIASSGVGALLAMVEQFRESSARVRLAELSPAVDSVIRLLNLDQFLTIDDKEDDSITALAA